ncbi:MAG: 2-amino-4-hydroxy-6-hydroxymethyldihydropteridine diphosphokinase [bacterium]
MTSPEANPVAYLALGGNVGDVRESFDYARKRLAEATGRPVRASRLYRTAPWGESDQPDFLNMVVEIQWNQSPRDLLDLALSIEHECGRNRSREKRWGPRTLDIDLLVFGSAMIADTDLSIPHPRMKERTFVLAPLSDLAPDLIPPGWSRTVLQVLAERSDCDTAVPLDSPSP